MQLIRYAHPEFSLANHNIDNWFRSMFRGFDHFGSQPTGVGLNADLYEGEDAYYASFALPGLSKDDINIELSNSVLTISGEHKTEDNGNQSHTSFSRSLAVPDGINGEQISASMKNGMLTIEMPKAEERKPRAINIK